MTPATITPIRVSDPDLRRYIEGANADDVDWLGMLVIYSTAEVTVRYADLLSLLGQYGLAAFAPRKPSDVDVFRRSITSVQAKRQPTDDADVYLNIMTRDVSNDDVEVVKRLVIETVNAAGRRLAYDSFYDWIFTKASASMDIKRLAVTSIDPVAQKLADAVVMEAVQRYDALKGTVDGAAIRGVIHKALTESNATSFRPGGGCYFLHTAQTRIAAGLEQLAARIPGSLVHTVPLVDTVGQRAHIVACVEAESEAEVAEINKMVDEVAAVLRTGKDVTAERFATLARRVAKLTDKAEQYRTRLDADLVQTTSAVSILQMQMVQLSGMRPGRAPAQEDDAAAGAA